MEVKPVSKGEPPWARAAIGKAKHTAGIRVDRRLHLLDAWAVFNKFEIRILRDIVSSSDSASAAIFRRLGAIILRVQYFLPMAVWLRCLAAIGGSDGRYVR